MRKEKINGEATWVSEPRDGVCSPLYVFKLSVDEKTLMRYNGVYSPTSSRVYFINEQGGFASRLVDQTDFEKIKNSVLVTPNPSWERAHSMFLAHYEYLYDRSKNWNEYIKSTLGTLNGTIATIGD